MRTLDEASQPGAAITPRTLLSQLDALIISVVSTLDGEAEVGRGRASCRSLMLRRSAHAASDRKEVQRLRHDAGGLAHGLGQMEVARRGAEAPVPKEAL